MNDAENPTTGHFPIPSPADGDGSKAASPHSAAVDLGNTSTHTQSSLDASVASPSLPMIAEISQDRTVVSSIPVAGIDEFYPTGSIASLASVLIGQQLDHYLLHELVGGGGMGAVFKASDTRLDRIVAVKVIPNLDRDQETLRRFRIEAQSAAKLDHPNIARVYYVGETAAWSYIVFEYVEGINLRDLVVRNGPLSIDDAVYYTSQISDALQHATDRSVVHRDIKPSNALVTPEGLIKVVDMGLARTTSLARSTNDLTASGVTLGTFDYISPEQARDPRAADVRSDLYSLGCTLYYLLAGRPPYHEGTAIQKLLMHGETPAEDLRKFRDDIPLELITIVRKLMAKRPRDRYQQPIDLTLDLRLLASDFDLAKSQTRVDLSSQEWSSEPSWYRQAIPWGVGLLLLMGSTAYLYQQYVASASFSISKEITQRSASGTTVNKIRSDASLATGTAAVGISPEMKSVNTSKASHSDSNLEVGTQNKTRGLVNEMVPANDFDSIAGLSIRSDLKNLPPLPSVEEKQLAKEAASKSMTSESIAIAEAMLLKRSSTADPRDLSNRHSPIQHVPEKIQGDIIHVRNLLGTSRTESSTEDISSIVVASTLEEAIGMANQNSDMNEIHLEEDVVQLNEPLVITRKYLTIRSLHGKRCRIQWNGTKQNLERESITIASSSEPSETATVSACVTLGNSTLRLIDLDWEVSAPKVSRGDVAFTSISSGGKLQMERSTLTLVPSGSDWKMAAIVVMGRGLNEPPQVELSDVIVRGSGDFMQLDTGIRSELQWRNGLLAIDGRLVNSRGASATTKTPTTIRLDLRDVTVAADQGLALVRLDASNPYPVCISRDAKNCTFAMQPGYAMILMEGVAWKDSADLQALIASWIDLRGVDNAYDEKIETLARLVSTTGESKRFGFEARVFGLLSDRAPETNVRWLNPIPINTPHYKRVVGDYLQQSSSAFRTGMRIDSLPPL